MYVWRNIGVLYCNNCRSGKTIIITYSMDMFVALGIQLVMRMRRVVICGPLGSITYSTLFNKRYAFRKKITPRNMWVLIFSTTFVWNISQSKKKWARCDKKCILVCMWSTGYSCRILMKFLFPRRIFEKKIFEYQISWKSAHWESSCPMTKLNSRF